MSWIEALESRVVLSVSVSAATLQTDAKAVTTLAATNAAALTALQKAQLQLEKVISATVKADGAPADKSTNAKLLARLSKQTTLVYAKLRAADAALTSLAKSSASSGYS